MFQHKKVREEVERIEKAPKKGLIQMLTLDYIKERAHRRNPIECHPIECHLIKDPIEISEGMKIYNKCKSSNNSKCKKRCKSINNTCKRSTIDKKKFRGRITSVKKKRCSASYTDSRSSLSSLSNNSDKLNNQLSITNRMHLWPMVPL